MIDVMFNQHKGSKFIAASFFIYLTNGIIRYRLANSMNTQATHFNFSLLLGLSLGLIDRLFLGGLYMN